MRAFRYQILNAFSETHFAGNPLAVFPDAAGLADAEMQQLAQQLNLSETTFVTPHASADACVRIFTPNYELPFAGHPTLGTAWVVAQGRADVTLAMPAGTIPVHVAGDIASLTAQPPRYRDAAASADIAAALRLPLPSVSGTPRWVNTGTEQLVVPLVSAEAVAACAPTVEQFEAIATNAVGVAQMLVWAHDGDEITARFFWVQYGAIGEDYGTGSAGANLAGWLLAEPTTLPYTCTMVQGRGIGRLAHVRIAIDADRAIRVSGRVVQVGEGVLTLPHQATA